MLSHYLQVQLYEDFAKSRAKASVEDSISEASTEEEEKPKLKATGHVFQVRLFSLDIVLGNPFETSIVYIHVYSSLSLFAHCCISLRIVETCQSEHGSNLCVIKALLHTFCNTTYHNSFFLCHTFCMPFIFYRCISL